MGEWENGLFCGHREIAQKGSQLFQNLITEPRRFAHHQLFKRHQRAEEHGSWTED